MPPKRLEEKKMASFDNKEQCDSCGEYQHERSMTFEQNQALCFSCHDEREEEGAESFMARLAANGYQVIHTGGGCTAFQKTFGHCDVMITQDASHDINEDYMADLGLVVGVYADDLEGQHLFFINPTHTNWDMIYGAVLQAENVAKSLDAISAVQKIEA
jgi:hypothetical protein